MIWVQQPARDRHVEPVFRAFFEEALGCGGTLIGLDRRDERTRFHGYNEAESEVEIGSQKAVERIGAPRLTA